MNEFAHHLVEGMVPLAPHPPWIAYDPANNHAPGFVIHGIKAKGESDGRLYFQFPTAAEALDKQLEMLKSHPDTVVGITHYGPDGGEIRRVGLHEHPNFKQL